MTRQNPEDYELFYAELPQTDYLNDIEIQDEYGETGEAERRGLSDEQVLEIAQDALADARNRQPSSTSHPESDTPTAQARNPRTSQ